MIRATLTALALWATPLYANADTIAAALAEDSVEIDVDFDGARVTLFGVSNAADDPDAAFVVALVGPSRPHAIVRNTPNGEERFEFVSAPSVLAVAAEPSIAEIVSPDALIRAGVNARYAAKPAPQDMTRTDLDVWRTAFADLKTEAGLFSGDMDGVRRLEGGLLRADIDLPAEAPAGEYDVRAFVFRDGEMVGEFHTPLYLERKGAESFLYNLSRDRGVLYGLIAVLVGVGVGGLGAYFGRR
ncbi:MAG: TIGR02186 family protein [Pseudomonadota bacterium]